jgi:thymidine kinase
MWTAKSAERLKEVMNDVQDVDVIGIDEGQFVRSEILLKSLIYAVPRCC